MNLIYYDLYQATRLEKFVTGKSSSVWLLILPTFYISLLIIMCFPFAAYGEFLKSNGEQPVTWKRASSMDEVLIEADVVCIF